MKNCPQQRCPSGTRTPPVSSPEVHNVLQPARPAGHRCLGDVQDVELRLGGDLRWALLGCAGPPRGKRRVKSKTEPGLAASRGTATSSTCGSPRGRGNRGTGDAALGGQPRTLNTQASFSPPGLSRQIKTHASRQLIDSVIQTPAILQDQRHVQRLPRRTRNNRGDGSPFSRASPAD